MSANIPKLRRLVHTKKVTIGPYRIKRERISMKPPIISDPDQAIGQGKLYDDRMGVIDRLTTKPCGDDFAKCFGTNGIVSLNVYIVHPSFKKILQKFLKLFKPVSSTDSGITRYDLDFAKPDLIGKAIRDNSHKTEYRRLGAIIKAVGSTGSWDLDSGRDESGDSNTSRVTYKSGSGDKSSSTFTVSTLREMLIRLSNRLTSGANITYKMLGINADIARPEHFIIDAIPVIQNPLRAPSSFPGSGRSSSSQYTSKYAAIVSASKDTNADVIGAYSDLISGTESTDDTFSLKNKIFSGKKENFIRGHMYTKVGGQIMRSVVTPDPRMKPHQVGIPRRLARDISQRVEVTTANLQQVYDLIADGSINYYQDKRTKEYIKLSKSSKVDIVPGSATVLRELQNGDVVCINRMPTLHRNSLLGFEVILHDDDTIKIHPSSTKGFGMDFDGDEANAYYMVSEQALREVRELMFIPFHMASLASSSLLVGYHQDVNIACHMMTMDATILLPHLWEKYARISHRLLFKDMKYDDWFTKHVSRCRIHNVNVYSGKSLYSTLLPINMNWSMGKCRVMDGILVSGTLESRTVSGASSSLGMVMYRTYGHMVCIDWLNASYHMLNEYLLMKGLTLGFKHVELNQWQQRKVDEYIAAYKSRKDLLVDVNTIDDPVLSARKEVEITQELNNVRESIAMVVMKPSDKDIALQFRGVVNGPVTLYLHPYTYTDPRKVKPTITTVPSDDIRQQYGSIDINDSELYEEIYTGTLDLKASASADTSEPTNIPGMKTNTIHEDSDDEDVEPTSTISGIVITEDIRLPNGKMSSKGTTYTFDGKGGIIDIDLYNGIIRYTIDSKTYTLGMGVVYRIVCTITTSVMVKDNLVATNMDIDRTYETPNQLIMMIESGARGNATNAIQISGIIGQQSYENGRIPRMIDDTSINIGDDVYTGSRSLPCYVPGENSPESRGFIAESYVQGMRPADYFNLHVASRENLTSNQDLTPQTGYFSRRVRTFTENLQMKKVDGRLVVVNEKDVMVMMDYVFDPSRMFRLGSIQTFVDIKHEIATIRSTYTNDAIYIYIPYLRNMEQYVKYDANLRETIRLNKDTMNVIVAIDPRICTSHPYYYKYLRTELEGILVVTIPTDQSEAKRRHWYMALDNYNSIAVVPIFPTSSHMIGKPYHYKDEYSVGTSAYIDVATPGISRIVYTVGYKSGEVLTTGIMYQMIRNGTDFIDYPMIVKPSKVSYDLLDRHTLFEVLLMTGDVRMM